MKKGSKRSPEANEKQRQAMLGRVPWNKGVILGPQSESVKAKKAETMRQKWADPEERTRRTLANQGGGAKRRESGTSYAGVHQRLAWLEERGEKLKGDCRHCGKPAEEWALMQDSERIELDEPTMLLFSPFVEDYMGLCKLCHRKYDENARKAWETRRAMQRLQNPNKENAQ